MPLKKIIFKPGVNRENTRYTTEGGFYECDKIRFRQGTPEVIGGWTLISANTYLGICRSLWAWSTLGSLSLIGVGTNLKFYIENGGAYYDITPLRATTTLNGPFTTDGTTTVTVTDAAGGYSVGDFVTFSNATTVGGVNLNGQYQIQSTPTTTTYTITAASAPTAVVGGGGSAVYAAYQIKTGTAVAIPLTGWGGGGWGLGTWGVGAVSTQYIRIWNQMNFGEDLVYGPRGGAAYYWDASMGLTGSTFTITVASPGVLTASSIAFTDGMAFTLYASATPPTAATLPTGLTPGTVYYAVNSSGNTCQLSATPGGTPINISGAGSGTFYLSPRGIALSALPGASDVPLMQNFLLVSDTSRFTIFFGTNDIGSATVDPMLVRWSDQESVVDWTPSATNQAGSLRLSHGSKIVVAQQSRQEIVVWTDSSVYSLQYLGPPIVWGSQLLADSISIVGPNATALASGKSYWMGVDKFYVYDGRVQTLRCDLRRYVFSNFNFSQADQVYCNTNEGFNEIWWFYPSANSTVNDLYVVYNYAEDIWYYGTIGRTAWLDSGLRQYPVAATYSQNLVDHENGLNDNETGTPVALNAYILSSEFDIDDGHNFSFIWRILPDLTFNGSTASSPAVTMYLYPLENSGSGYNDPGTEQSVGGTSYASVQRTAILPVEKFTGQIYTRVRGRQLAFKIASNQLNTTWQLGAPRFDIRADGRR